MQKYHNQHIYSASDLVDYLECEHLTALNLINLETPLPKVEDDDQTQLIQKKGYEHESNYLAALRAQGIDVVDIKADNRKSAAAIQATRQAMADGAAVIFQGCLKSDNLLGVVDFLRRVERPSLLGDYSYEVVDTKLARKTKTKFIIQLCFYSDLLSDVQGVLPQTIHVVLGDRTEQSYRLADFYKYYRSVKSRFMDHVQSGPQDTYPEPCAHCDMCHWRELCKSRWQEDDHLCQVANITKTQINKLHAANICTLAALGKVDSDSVRVSGMPLPTLQKLQRQAALQLSHRDSGEDLYEYLSTLPEERRGFQRLPRPDEGDLFFDMEGDPLEDGGLEYLFGLYYFDRGEPIFKPFWAHNRQEERTAFKNFMAFVMERLAAYPRMHIYHYAPYEVTALKRLMSLHGTCEAQVDHLLRNEKLVDLYKVVRESILISEPRYSIKNLETFYMEKRSGEVTNAGASIVYYENWKESSDPDLLQKIQDYNEDDCRSTYLLREWLLSIRPAETIWFNDLAEEDSDNTSEQTSEIEARLADYQEQLLGPLPEDRSLWDKEAFVRELVFQLLDFHRRTEKPVWWAMFSRHDMSEEELIDDPESLGGLAALEGSPPVPIKRSMLYSYRYPEQEFKFKVGDNCQCADTLEPAGTIEAIDEKARIIRLKRGKSKGDLPQRLSIIPGGPISTKPLKEALFRFADSVIAGESRYVALEAILNKRSPNIDGLEPDQPIIANQTEITREVYNAVQRLNNSHLFIQGPPGAGKTYTGSHVIVDLLEQGAKVGVSSNSHKAINNLLAAVEKRAAEKGVDFEGIKKCSGEDSAYVGTHIVSTTSKEDVIYSDAQLVAGTAWLFSDPAMDQTLDYLFVDEAGQVALANLIAMGTSAKNLVLLGDQMQLQQPIQGVHPGHSGESTLDYLLQGQATIADDRGVFLATTWRMHEDVCGFISDAVYDSRLHPETANRHQRILLNPKAHPQLRPTGICFVATEHDGNGQRSEEEAAVVAELYNSLMSQQYVDREGNTHPMTADNILVVAPYNMQVNLLKERLPDNARVGTVDKFQGQEAEAVIVSMATSSGEYLPRHIEFLYSKNRINVAISRARCLALVVASPELMAIKCNTVEQMGLVNTLCWLAEKGL